MSIRPLLAMAAVGAVAGFVAGGCFLWLAARDASAEPVARAPVPAEAQAAVDAYAGHIEHVIARGDTGERSETWLDPVTRRGRELILRFNAPLTRPLAGVATVQVGDVEETYYVDYADLTWTSRSHAAPCSLLPANLATALAQQVWSGVASGELTIAGHSTLRGRDVLELHGTPRGREWVDPLTYVPLRTQFAFSSAETYWLQRTPRNIAKTALRVPAGFKHVRWDAAYSPVLFPGCS